MIPRESVDWRNSSMDGRNLTILRDELGLKDNDYSKFKSQNPESASVRGASHPALGSSEHQDRTHLPAQDTMAGWIQEALDSLSESGDRKKHRQKLTDSLLEVHCGFISPNDSGFPPLLAYLVRSSIL